MRGESGSGSVLKKQASRCGAQGLSGAQLHRTRGKQEGFICERDLWPHGSSFPTPVAPFHSLSLSLSSSLSLWEHVRSEWV